MSSIYIYINSLIERRTPGRCMTFELLETPRVLSFFLLLSVYKVDHFVVCLNTSEKNQEPPHLRTHGISEETKKKKPNLLYTLTTVPSSSTYAAVQPVKTCVTVFSDWDKLLSSYRCAGGRLCSSISWEELCSQSFHTRVCVSGE